MGICTAGLGLGSILRFVLSPLFLFILSLSLSIFGFLFRAEGERMAKTLLHLMPGGSDNRESGDENLEREKEKLPEREKDGVTPTSISESNGADIIEKQYPNGDLYTGTFANNIRHGWGKYLGGDGDGDMYEGEWKEGKMSGKGKFWCPSGTTYEGEFKSGYGVQHYSNGDYYEGQWRRDLPDGHGRCLWGSGNEYVGEWKNGTIHGRGVLMRNDGARYYGDWENGVPKGSGLITWPDGSRYIGCWSRYDPRNNGNRILSGTLYPSHHAKTHILPATLNETEVEIKFIYHFSGLCKIEYIVILLEDYGAMKVPSSSAFVWFSLKFDPNFNIKSFHRIAVSEFPKRLRDGLEMSNVVCSDNITSISPNGKFRRVIEGWRKGDRLGRGSFGSVYEGIADDGFFFAVKEVSLLDEGDHEKQSIIQLEHEIALLSQFEHENIVQYYGTKKDESHLYIFLEHVPKGSLRSLYQKYELQPPQVSAYTRQILEGLKYLHDRNVVHRDIKCANILVHINAVVKLADFGLAKVTKLNDVMSCKGTWRWMAPEVVRCQGYGLPADIWSLGSTVLEMLTGRHPYSEFEEAAAALFRIGRGERPLIPDSLPNDARDFILECLQVDPSLRPTANQLLDHPFVKRPLQSYSGTMSPHSFSKQI